MELVAVLLPVLVLAGVVALVGVAIVLRWPELVGSAFSWALMGVAAVLLPWLPISTGHAPGGVTIAVANVLFDNGHPTRASADIIATGADVVVVPEYTLRFHPFLSTTYPYQATPRYGPAVAVLAKVPITVLPRPSGIYTNDRFLRIRIDTPTPFVLWALHLPRPWLTYRNNFQLKPGGHARVLSRFLHAIDQERLPVVVAGDLNLTDRGRGYRKFTEHLDDAVRSIRGGRTEVKRFWRPLLLNIDHILEPPSWCADHAGRFDITGSDHRGVVARVGPCGPAEDH